MSLNALPVILAVALSSLLAFLSLELLGVKALLFAFLFFATFLLTLHFLCLRHLNALQAELQDAEGRREQKPPFEAHFLKRLLPILAEELSKPYPPCRILRALKGFLTNSYFSAFQKREVSE